MSQFTGLLISIVVSFVLAIVLTYIVGFDEDVPENDNAIETNDTKSSVSPNREQKDKDGAPKTTESRIQGFGVEMGSPVKGKTIPLSQVNDEAFASGAMGDGLGIIPSEGKIYAPLDGTAEAVFPTGHAVGLVTEEGREILIHIGIDTVQLEGKGFYAHVEQGDRVKKGDLLIEFDPELIQKEGYDPTVIYILTDMEQVAKLDVRTNQNVEAMETVMYVEGKEHANG